MEQLLCFFPSPTNSSLLGFSFCFFIGFNFLVFSSLHFSFSFWILVWLQIFGTFLVSDCLFFTSFFGNSLNLVGLDTCRGLGFWSMECSGLSLAPQSQCKPSSSSSSSSYLPFNSLSYQIIRFLTSFGHTSFWFCSVPLYKCLFAFPFLGIPSLIEGLFDSFFGPFFPLSRIILGSYYVQ